MGRRFAVFAGQREVHHRTVFGSDGRLSWVSRTLSPTRVRVNPGHAFGVVQIQEELYSINDLGFGGSSESGPRGSFGAPLTNP